MIIKCERVFHERRQNLQRVEGIWKIERYGTHDKGKWTEVFSADHLIFFAFQDMCLTLQHGNILVDHISLLTENVRLLRKDESLGIIVVKENVRTKKLRLKFAGSGLHPGVKMIQLCVDVLKPFVRVQDVTPKQQLNLSPENRECKQLKRPFGSTTLTQQTGNMQQSNYFGNGQALPLSDLVSQILNKRVTDFYEDNKDLSFLYPLEDIVESCILDTDFPSFVAQVHRVLTEKLKK